ncbi:hypothetical protein AKO1_004267 [Acrasis kona]|uniref:F-box domain-containing protein n=1 Tax=Acrasis kona TaxID=1008807 RepID=A0AAW2Z5Y0_9EUKA
MSEYIFIPDILSVVLTFLPRNPECYCTLRLINKSTKLWVDRDDNWEDIWYERFPGSRGIICCDFFRSYIMMRSYITKLPKTSLKIIAVGFQRSSDNYLKMKYIICGEEVSVYVRFLQEMWAVEGHNIDGFIISQEAQIHFSIDPLLCVYVDGASDEDIKKCLKNLLTKIFEHKNNFIDVYHTL